MSDLVCRLLIDPPADGAWNMAVDEILLLGVERTGQPVFRIYQWRPATLSLGYFQRWQERCRHRPSWSCPMVRRPSGGGAIVHDRELTYCLALPYGRLPPEGPSGLYGLVHESLLDVFHQWGLPAGLWQCACPTADRQEEPFLCFQRRNRWDVVVDGPDGEGVKVVGSAQRRTRSALLQHGSILLARSPAAPELPGLSELLDRFVSPEELWQAWFVRLTDKFRWSWAADALTEPERAEAQRLAQTKYGTDSWNLRR
jgi:lipoate-protein ligase A